MQPLAQELDAEDYRRIRLIHVQREVARLKREEWPVREALSRAAIEALAERLKALGRQP